MKIKQTYKLRTVAGENMVVNTGNEPGSFNGVIMLNDTGAFLWKILENGAEREDLISAVLKEYNTDEKTAEEGVDSFLDKVKGANLCE